MRLRFVLAALLVGCSTAAPLDAPGVDAAASDAPGTDAPDIGPYDAGPPPACDGDVVCPADRPYSGTTCLTGLSCPYSIAECMEPGRAICLAGEWTWQAPPMESCLLGGFTPPSAERCRDPFMGTMAGELAVTLPEGAFNWGPQGGAMLAVDLAVTGAAAALTCVPATVDVRIDGMPEPQARYALRMRCGESHGIYVILGTLPCEERPYLVEVSATVEGVASASTSAMLMGGQTTGLPVCSTGG